MAGEHSRGGARAGRRRRAALVGGGVVLAILAGVWAERKPIAADVIDRELARRGVSARYRVAAIALGRQRLVDVVIGDPRAPDLFADWVEAETHLGLDGARVTGLRAGRVRLRARVADGRLSLGSIDRLLPASSGSAFALPALDLDVADARVRLDTPAGLVGLRLSGRGRVDGGFRGTLAAVAPRLAANGCIAGQVSAAVRVGVTRSRPSITGPVAAATLDCAGVRATNAVAGVEVTLGPALDRWDGKVRLAAGQVAHPAGRLADVTGAVTVSGTRAGLGGVADLMAASFTTAEASGGGLALAGSYRVAGRALDLGTAVPATLSARAVTLSPTRLGSVNRLASMGAGTPVAPLLRRLAVAAEAAGERFDASASFVAHVGGATRINVDSLRAGAAGGAQGRWDGGALRWVQGQPVVTGGALRLGGGGLPDAVARLYTVANGIGGIATVQPYAAGGATLSLAPVRFAAGAKGNGRVVTAAILSGPIAGGRVDALTLPVDARWSGANLILNPSCGAWTAERVAVRSLALTGPKLSVCPIDGALVRVTRGRVSGGARVQLARLSGRVGASPLTLTMQGATLNLQHGGFAATDVAVRLGAPDRVTRLAVASLSGALDASPGGRFTGASGQIGAVPLLLSDAHGTWRIPDGVLAVTGELTVSDANTAAPRFKPLPAQDVQFRLASHRIDVIGTLAAPGVDRTVARFAISHDLSRGAGEARFTLPGLMFDKALQPDALTPVTFGVIADVAGTVTGEGRIAWSGAGVTGTGAFRTAGTDLAAAFGPVQGITGEVRFTDLLALRSAPDQRLTVRSVNPGIPVTDGLVRFEMLDGTRIKVNRGDWPFAGGTLVLRPTLLDFSTPREHALTFEVTGVDARQFLAQFDFRNMDATGTFDGVLPILFDQAGGRIEGGRLTVRQGGGTIAYVGELGQKDLGFWSNLAFQALKSLRYRRLGVSMDGPLAGEMITQVRFEGLSQGQGAKSNFLIRRLQKLPFVFNVRIKAPFRGLIDSAQSFYDPSRLIQRNLPALIEAERAAAIQPPASEKTP